DILRMSMIREPNPHARDIPILCQFNQSVNIHCFVCTRPIDHDLLVVDACWDESVRGRSATETETALNCQLPTQLFTTID
ncbi:hypothetical protein, partial [Mycobacterium kyogaense]|uniref:hypothetical protein n=1 Tax=Mycobacterium kyogaense TaxID=2212479 RepID=UPI001968DE8E